MIKQKRMEPQKKISILKLTVNCLNTWTLKTKIMWTILSLSVLLMGLIKRGNIRLLLMREECNSRNCKRSMRSKRDSLRLWAKLRMKTLMCLEISLKMKNLLQLLSRSFKICRKRLMKRKEFWWKLPQWS